VLSYSLVGDSEKVGKSYADLSRIVEVQVMVNDNNGIADKAGKLMMGPLVFVPEPQTATR